jgi:hypothetical protein
VGIPAALAVAAGGPREQRAAAVGEA